MSKLIEYTVTMEAPLPFSEADATAFVDAVEEPLLTALETAAKAVLTKARHDHVPLASVTALNVTD